ncbi:hypothetical protein HanPI659440_Chr04g0141401 [Helianthus annuus]|nr:hypothetical protein HanPI659440_Chr04g0141401 [Helianthus annuus]
MCLRRLITILVQVFNSLLGCRVWGKSPTPSSSGDAGTPRRPPPVPSSAAASGRW